MYKTPKIVYSAVTTSSTTVTLSGQASELILTATQKTYFNFSSAAVAVGTGCNSMYLPADMPMYVGVDAPSSIYAIATAAGHITIIENF